MLNQIDGLGDDVDVTFVLTTNRVDILERALAERPGRVDAAIEIAVPDADGRVRLLRLYGAELGVAATSDDDLAAVVAATEGRTATYLREVVRRAALLAASADPDGALLVDSSMLLRAAEALAEDHVALSHSLLGDVADEAGGTFALQGSPGWGHVNMVRTMIGHRGGGPPGSAPAFGPEPRE